MKRYEAISYGSKWCVWDNTDGRFAATFPDWNGADDWAEKMNRSPEHEEPLGVEAAWPQMMRKQA